MGVLLIRRIGQSLTGATIRGIPRRFTRAYRDYPLLPLIRRYDQVYHPLTAG
jgi:hypothetical protein